jgi:phytoene dehydrogenase-like protein
MTYDAIIIGSGLGGLFAGAKLAKEGKKVCMLEQHDRPGGCATTFKRLDYTMEVGLHEMDGLHEGDMKNRIFEELGIDKEVTFLELPEFFRFHNGRTDIVMPHTREEAERVLTAHFPKEKKGILAYFERLMNYKRIHVKERDQPDISVGEYLDSIIDDDELKLVLMGNLGYFHDDPYSLSMRYFAVAESAYFHGRANFIQGGSQVMSKYLAKYIKGKGGLVMMNASVEEIVVEDGLANKVRYRSTIGKNNAVKEIEAKEIVANCSLDQLTKLLSHSGKELKKEIKKHENGASLLTVYFGFSKSLKEQGNKHYSTFVYDESVKSIKDIHPNNHAPFKSRSFTMVDYSQIDSQLAPSSKSVAAICCLDYLEDWEGLSRDEYRMKKKEVEDAFSARIDALVPGCREYLEFIEVGTSRTVERYTRNPGGAVYGFAQLPNRVPIQKVPEIANIHIASAWGKFGGGFSGAIFSGYMCAMEMLRARK